MGTINNFGIGDFLHNYNWKQTRKTVTIGNFRSWYFFSEVNWKLKKLFLKK
jgi:hypothetical protein